MSIVLALDEGTANAKAIAPVGLMDGIELSLSADGGFECHRSRRALSPEYPRAVARSRFKWSVTAGPVADTMSTTRRNP